LVAAIGPSSLFILKQKKHARPEGARRVQQVRLAA